METIEQSGEAEKSAAHNSWSGGDLESDWRRFEGQFDRLDAGVRHRMQCAIALDALLVVVVVALLAMRPSDGTGSLATTIGWFLSWLGMSASLSFYWAQCRSSDYRRELQRTWNSRYPSVRPTPYGQEVKDSGLLNREPGALLALLSSVFWFFVFATSLALVWAGGDRRALGVVNLAQFSGAILLGLVTLTAFYNAKTSHFARSSSETRR